MKARTRKMDRKMDILMASVEKGQQVDPALLVAAEEGNGKYKLKRNILNRLVFGSIFSLLGAVLFIIPVLLGPSTSAIAAQKRNSAFFVIGAILLAVGAGLLISYFVGRKMLAKEIETIILNILLCVAVFLSAAMAINPAMESDSAVLLFIVQWRYLLAGLVCVSSLLISIFHTDLFNYVV